MYEVVTENAGEPVVTEPVVDGRPVITSIRTGLVAEDAKALTTVIVHQRRTGLSLAFAFHDACADARRATPSALACFEDFVVLALSDWD